MDQEERWVSMAEICKHLGSSRDTIKKMIKVQNMPAYKMYGKEASNRKQEIDRQHYTIPNQRPKDKHCGKI